MRRAIQAIVCGIMLLASPSYAASQKEQKTEAFPLKVFEKDLPNGLRVMVVPTDFPKLVSVQIPVQTGSRNEIEAGKTGFAHFFEHMMFRGTKNMSAAEYQALLTGMGARQNAYTSGDYTNYHTTLSKDDLEQFLKMEADRFMNLEYGESEFKTEARAVLGEYNKNSANPGMKLWETLKDKAFKVHTYKHTTMGFLKDIEDMPNQFAYSKTFFDRWYRPEYTTVIVAGDVTPEKIFKMVETYFGPWKRGSYKVAIPKEPEPSGPLYVHVPWDNPTPAQLAIGFRTPAFAPDSKEYAALSLAFEIYFGETSPLYKRLVIDEQKVNSLGGRASRSRDPDLSLVGAQLKDYKDVVTVRDAILRTFAEARSQTVAQDRLNEVRSNDFKELARGLDNTESIAALLAAFAHYERRSDIINRYYRSLAQVTPADVQKVAQKYFQDQSLVVTSLSKETLPAELAQLPKLDSLLNKTKTLANVKIIEQSNQLPFLNVKLMFRAGSAFDPQGKEGLAALSASMISEAGSKLYRYEEIQKALYPLAASFGSRVDKELTTFTLRMHRDNAKQVLDLVIPSLLEAGLREDDFTRIKQAQLVALKTNLRANNEEELGKERLQELVFAQTRYAHPVLGTVASLEALTVEDVRDYIRKAYTQKALTVGINGKIPGGFSQDLRSALGDLPAGDGLPAPSIQPKNYKGLAVNIIEKNTRATAISIGHPLRVTRRDPDFAALWLARAWLGEHRSSLSHLYQRIREVRGMNYGDYAYIEAFPGGMYQFFPPTNVARQSQLFEIWIRPVMPENAHMALRIALFELQNMIEKGLTQEQFEKTRDYLLKNVYVMTATQDQQIGYALDSEFYGTGEFTATMRAALTKLSLEDVNKALKKHLTSKDLQIVAITQDAEGLKKKLLSDEVSTIKYDGEKDQALLDEDKVIGSMKLNISKDAVQITPVESIFAGKLRTQDETAATR